MTETITNNKWRILGAAVLLAVGVTAVYLGVTYAKVEATEPESPDVAAETTTDEAAEESTAIPVEVAEIVSGPVASYISATANLVPEDEVKVLAEAEGRVTHLNVEEGDRVTRGQALAAVDRSQTEIDLAKAEVRATNAELAWKRAEDTMEQGLISREEFDRLTMEFEVAKQEVAEAQWRLSRTVIRAPFEGVITERFINLGQHLRPGDEVFSVADFDPLIARIYLPEKDVLTLEEGREVGLVLAADSDLRFDGRIRQISPVVDTATGTVKVTVEAVSAPPQVRPGAFVSVEIIRERRDAAVLLPRESVIRELRTAHVFIANGDTAEKRPVTLGLEEGEVVEAVSGVEAGETVIVAGQGGLKPGAKVKVL
jgi:membrane fusion protein (multidrug efflux system)